MIDTKTMDILKEVHKEIADRKRDIQRQKVLEIWSKVDVVKVSAFGSGCEATVDVHNLLKNDDFITNHFKKIIELQADLAQAYVVKWNTHTDEFKSKFNDKQLQKMIDRLNEEVDEEIENFAEEYEVDWHNANKMFHYLGCDTDTEFEIEGYSKNDLTNPIISVIIIPNEQNLEIDYFDYNKDLSSEAKYISAGRHYEKGCWYANDIIWEREDGDTSTFDYTKIKFVGQGIKRNNDIDFEAIGEVTYEGGGIDGISNNYETRGTHLESDMLIHIDNQFIDLYTFFDKIGRNNMKLMKLKEQVGLK